MDDGKPMIQVGEEIFYDPSLKLLICKLHGNGLHSSDTAIKRHLRGNGHRIRGQALVRVLNTLAKLPLASLVDLHDVQHGNAEKPLPPVRYLRIWKGWSCVPCEGTFLTTSLEVVQRHASAVHGRRRGEPALWKDCLLQTLFSETKDRRYFRVAEPHPTSSHVTGIVQEDSKIYQSSREDEVREFHPISSQGYSHVGPHLSKVLPFQAPQELKIPQAILLPHPFMRVAEKYVPLSGSRLNYLLKSTAFRSASMPIFDSSPMNMAMSMQAVFPESEDSAVWANALLYSTVQIMNRGTPTVEGQLLYKKTIQFMNRKLSFPDETLCSAAVGAIMVLKATAYKTCDVMAHDIHTRGLVKILDFLTRTGNRLTPAAQKALFWLDLNAAASIESERQMSHLDLPRVFWRREVRPEAAHYLPTGFTRHRDAFPYGLPECIADLDEFQARLREDSVAQRTPNNRYAQLESMQASIESRLVFQAHACRQFGQLAEAVRIAVYICAYSSWMETWNISLLPCRLATKLFDFIESVLDLEIEWDERADLILWLVFISSSAAELDEGQVEGIKTRRNSVLSHMSRKVMSLARNTQEGHSLALRRALNDFIYVDGWVVGRFSIPAWHQLELDINHSSLKDQSSVTL